MEGAVRTASFERNLILCGFLFFNLWVTNVGGFAPVPSISPRPRTVRAGDVSKFDGTGHGFSMFPVTRRHCPTRIFRPAHGEEGRTASEVLSPDRITSLPDGVTIRPLSHHELCSDAGKRLLMKVRYACSRIAHPNQIWPTRTNTTYGPQQFCHFFHVPVTALPSQSSEVLCVCVFSVGLWPLPFSLNTDCGPVCNRDVWRRRRGRCNRRDLWKQVRMRSEYSAHKQGRETVGNFCSWASRQARWLLRDGIDATDEHREAVVERQGKFGCMCLGTRHKFITTLTPPLLLRRTQQSDVKRRPFISDMCIAPAYRRRGIARQLLTECERIVTDIWSQEMAQVHYCGLPFFLAT